MGCCTSTPSDNGDKRAQTIGSPEAAASPAFGGDDNPPPMTGSPAAATSPASGGDASPPRVTGPPAAAPASGGDASPPPITGETQSEPHGPPYPWGDTDPNELYYNNNPWDLSEAPKDEYVRFEFEDDPEKLYYNNNPWDLPELRRTTRT